ncbi:MAG: hypothetical protein MOGMAGMI_00446 [Candidatus Omnitrophica bacterium]|nr:hypothetical protein [Candidatus Omnitrophota bacterium]
MRSNTFFSLLLMCLLVTPSAAAAEADLSAAVPEMSVAADPSSVNLFMIYPGDKVHIQVFREPDLSGIFTVNRTGNINYPFLGEIHVEGLTLDELKAYLTNTLGKDYLVNPQIQIEFEESPNKSVSILGQVARPGNYILTPNMTLIRLISHVGGFTVTANEESVKILRLQKGGGKTSLTVDVPAITRGDAVDVGLVPGDVIFIEKRKEEEKVLEEKVIPRVSVLGHVSRPGNYELTANLTLIRLLSEAGGFTPLAAQSRVRVIRRGAEGSPDTQLTVNVTAILDGKEKDLPMQEGDIVVVPETFF